MKTLQPISVATFLLASFSSFALVLIEPVSKELAKDLGASIRTEIVGTNQVGVWLEFAPKGKLQTFSSVVLEIASTDGKLVSASLSPLKQTPDTVVFYFSTDAEHVHMSTLTVFYKIDGGWPPYDGFRFNVSDFVTTKTSADAIERLVASGDTMKEHVQWGGRTIRAWQNSKSLLWQGPVLVATVGGHDSAPSARAPGEKASTARGQAISFAKPDFGTKPPARTCQHPPRPATSHASLGSRPSGATSF